MLSTVYTILIQEIVIYVDLSFPICGKFYVEIHTLVEPISSPPVAEVVDDRTNFSIS